MTVTLRAATVEDSDRLLTWRNDPAAVSNSRSGSPVSPEEHAQWFDARMRRASPRLWIAEVDGCAVGQVRLDVDGGTGVVSIAVAPDHRGRGHAVAMLQALIHVAEDDPEVQRIAAVVRADNQRSLRAFSRVGFTEVRELAAGWLELSRAVASPPPAPGDRPPPPGRRLAGNTIVNGLANGLGALLTIALTPFFLHRLGAAPYGVWLLGLSLTFSSGYVVLADLGLQDAVIRFVAEAHALDATEAINRIASCTFAIFMVAGITAAVGVLLVAPLIVTLFHVPSGLQQQATLIFRLIALGIVLELPTAAFLALIEGAQHYRWLRTIDTGARVGWAVMSVSAVLAGGSVVWLAIASVAMTTLQAAVSVPIARRVHPQLALRPSLVDRATLRRLFGYGWLLSVLRIVTVVYTQMDRAIVGIAMGVAAVARYEVVSRVHSVALFARVTASSAVMPAAASNAARMDHEAQRNLYLRGSRYAVAFALPITLAGMLYARPLVATWMGAAYADLAAPAQIFLIFPLFWCLHSVGVEMLMGQGRIRLMTAIQTASVLLNLMLSIVLVRPLGLTGVILGTVIANAIAFPAYLRIMLTTFGCSLRSWALRVVVPNLPGVAAQVVFGLLTVGVAERSANFWAVVSLCTASCGVSVAAFLGLGISRSERTTVISRRRPDPVSPPGAGSRAG